MAGFLLMITFWLVSLVNIWQAWAIMGIQFIGTIVAILAIHDEATANPIYSFYSPFDHFNDILEYLGVFELIILTTATLWRCALSLGESRYGRLGSGSYYRYAIASLTDYTYALKGS